MRYKQKIVKLPEGMGVGSKVNVSGEGDEVFTITDILYKNGQVDLIVLDCGWKEPLSKIWTLGFEERVFVAIGECDVCQTTFPDSCVYHREESNPDSMICQVCFQKQKKETFIGKMKDYIPG